MFFYKVWLAGCTKSAVSVDVKNIAFISHVSNVDHSEYPVACKESPAHLAVTCLPVNNFSSRGAFLYLRQPPTHPPPTPTVTLHQADHLDLPAPQPSISRQPAPEATTYCR